MNDSRITQYALGELRGVEREEFEKELAQSEDLQRELQETIAVCEGLRGLPSAENVLEGQQRNALRESCRVNVKVAPRRIERKRLVVYGTLGALAACLLLVPLMPWAEVSEIANNQPQTRQNADPGFFVETSVMPSATPAMVGSNAMSGALDIQAASPQLAAKSADPVSQELLAKLRDENQRLINEGEGFYNSSRYDLAVKRYEQVLNNDPYNIAARRGLEKVHMSRQAYVTTAQNDAMESMLWMADRSWERPVPRFARSYAQHAPTASLSVSAGSWGVLASATASDQEQVRREMGPSSQEQSLSNEEAYGPIEENAFRLAKEHPLSTFSIDVDTASYANVRRFLQEDRLPPADAVRVEELINYFSYDYAQPENGQPFSVNVETAAAPWAPKHELVRIALKGRELLAESRPPANLVFLVDVSGSMESENKLPLLKRSLKELAKNLSPKDQVAIVTYAGTSEVVLPSTPGKEAGRIVGALDRLNAGGGTDGGAGIRMAYETAREHFRKDGNNRVILCSDGDFNVGIISREDLVALIEKERQSGVFLSVLGFGDGNLKDATMEMLADKGNGNYSYIDSFAEGRKVLVEQMSGTLFTIAKDVKVQVEFNPAQVAGYRLIGYENRLLAKEDFNDDKKDAGEIGAGHTVTALYEVVRAGDPVPDQPSVDPLKYQTPAPAEKVEANSLSGELLTVKLRYKEPTGSKSQLIEMAVPAGDIRPFAKASSDFQFAVAVAAFGAKLRGSDYGSAISWEDLLKIARRNLGEDPGSHRAEFLTLIERASRLEGDK